MIHAYYNHNSRDETQFRMNVTDRPWASRSCHSLTFITKEFNNEPARLKYSALYTKTIQKIYNINRRTFGPDVEFILD
jgi:hypothetical protein